MQGGMNEGGMNEGRKGYRADVVFDGERFLDGGALVLVEGGVVVAVEQGRAAAPDGVEVVHPPGTTLLPGLVNTHTHLCADGGPSALDQLGELTEDDLHRIVAAALHGQVAAGVTTVRDLGDQEWFVADRRAARDGLPRVLASGPPITVGHGHCAVMGGAIAGAPGTRVPALRAAVEARAERGVDVVKIMASGGVMTPGTDPAAAQFEPAELRAVVETAHGYGLPVTAHSHALDAVRSAVDAGVDGIEHCTSMTRRGPLLPADVLAGLAAARIAVCPTAGRVGRELPARTRAAMERFHLTLETFVRHFGALHEAGVRLLAGDDSGITPDKPHGIMPAAVADLVSYGLSVPQALASATGDAADTIGLRRVTGRLRPGLAADLLIVEGDLRRGVEALTRPVTVVVRGACTRPAG